MKNPVIYEDEHTKRTSGNGASYINFACDEVGGKGIFCARNDGDKLVLEVLLESKAVINLSAKQIISAIVQYPHLASIINNWTSGYVDGAEGRQVKEPHTADYYNGWLLGKDSNDRD